YSSYWAFRRRVCREEPIYGPGGYVLGYKVVGLKNPELMRYELEPIVLSRTRAMLGLPPITHETVWVGMSDRQRRLYRQLRTTGCWLPARRLRRSCGWGRLPATRGCRGSRWPGRRPWRWWTSCASCWKGGTRSWCSPAGAGLWTWSPGTCVGSWGMCALSTTAA